MRNIRKNLPVSIINAMNTKKQIARYPLIVILYFVKKFVQSNLNIRIVRIITVTKIFKIVKII